MTIRPTSFALAAFAGLALLGACNAEPDSSSALVYCAELGRDVPEGEYLVPIGKAAIRREGSDVTNPNLDLDDFIGKS